MEPIDARELPDEESIPIARYGSSMIGRLKYVYRRARALRYGKTMQCIAGIHYNFPAGEALAAAAPGRRQRAIGTRLPVRRLHRPDSQFPRYSWLLMYLFGASPALDAGFLRGRPSQLERLDEHTLYLPLRHQPADERPGLPEQRPGRPDAPLHNDLQSYIDTAPRPYPPREERQSRMANGCS